MLRRNLFYLLVILATVLVPVSVSADFADCGEWVDVSQADLDYNAFVTVCDFGYFKGNVDKELNPDQQLTRVETAVILNRIFGAYEGYDFASDSVEYSDKFFVDNKDKSEKEWIFRAVRNASQHTVDNQRIFKGYEDGTFRPLNSIKFIEFAKVALLGFKQSGNAAYNNTRFDLEKDPWYNDLELLLLNFEGASAIDPTNEGFKANTSLGSANLRYDSNLTRRQAIVFLASLIEQGYLYGENLYTSVDNGFQIGVPMSLIGKGNEHGVTFVASDGYEARTGIQRVAAGIYTVTADPEGIAMTVPYSLTTRVRVIRRFESCDVQAGNCQIAYFFIGSNDNPTYFLEVSYVQSKFRTAKPIIETIYQSFRVTS